MARVKNSNSLAENRKARHDYFVEETMEAGIELVGTEVKSIRGGKCNLKDCYADIKNGEIFILNMHISPYEQGNIFNVDPLRERKLLLHKEQIGRLAGLVSRDGYTFNNYDDKKIIIPAIMDESLGHRTHTRDPKVWKHKECYSMILGSKFKKKDNGKFTGEVLFYTSKDGEQWSYKNRFYDDSIGDMWECPDLFNVDGNYILVVSPENTINDGINYGNNAVYSMVNFDEDTCEMSLINNHKFLDEGLDLYAPQTTIDEFGNRILIGWMRMPIVCENENWIGMMSIPRVINVKNNEVYFTVPEYIDGLFDKKVKLSEFNVEETYKLKVTLNEESVLNIGGYKISVNKDKIVADRSEVFPEIKGIGRVFNSSKLNGRYELNIYIDNGIIEIFINDGKYVISNILYNLKSNIEAINVNNK